MVFFHQEIDVRMINKKINQAQCFSLIFSHFHLIGNLFSGA